MKIDQQIDMVKLIRESNRKEAKVWRKNNSTDMAWTCREYALACSAVLVSLRRLKRMDKR